jgi:hypothetical protein
VYHSVFLCIWVDFESYKRGVATLSRIYEQFLGCRKKILQVFRSHTPRLNIKFPRSSCFSFMMKKKKIIGWSGASEAFSSVSNETEI